MQKPANGGDRKELGALGCGILAPSSLVPEAVFGQMLLLGIKPKTKSSFSIRYPAGHISLKSIKW